MIATSPAEVSFADARLQFAAALPGMQRAIRYHARRIPKLDRDEFEVDVLAACWHAWHGLVRRGKDPLAVGVTGIVNNAVRYVLNGRRLGTATGGRNTMDVFTGNAQDRSGVHLVSIDQPTPSGTGTWRNLLSSRRSFTPADAACFRLDFEHWLETLSDRKRQMAELLAEGHETNVVASLLGVTAPAVSIARVWLESNWRAFQGETASASVAPVRPTERRPRKVRRDAAALTASE